MPNPRYAGLKPHPEALGVVRLTAGEISRPVRIRAPQEVHEWLKGMTAGEVGEALAEVMQHRLTLRYAMPEISDTLRNTQSGSALRSADALSGISALKVASQTVPQRLKNKLRWSPDRYTELEAVLAQTQALHLDLTNGKAVWRTDDDQPMRKDTVTRLFVAGVLVSV